MKLIFVSVLFFSFLISGTAQLRWQNVDSLYQPLPKSVHVYKTTDSMFDGKPNIAYYVIADLKDKHLLFDADTTYKRRLTPSQFYEKNKQPLLVVNTSFFSYETNLSQNVVISNGNILARNIRSVISQKPDTVNKMLIYHSAIGIDKRKKTDVAWVHTDSSKNFVEYAAEPRPGGRLMKVKRSTGETTITDKVPLHKWKMKTAVGGGPVLLQNGEIRITNEEEMIFRGKRIDEKEPRTAIGYTKDNKLIILVVQGRFPMIAEGASLKEEAQILKDLGCWEALNLDGGGSSCMLVNGKETIKPSSAGVQRSVPAVFIISKK